VWLFQVPFGLEPGTVLVAAGLGGNGSGAGKLGHKVHAPFPCVEINGECGVSDL
jgi:hypothetical protein